MKALEDGVSEADIKNAMQERYKPTIEILENLFKCKIRYRTSDLKMAIFETIENPPAVFSVKIISDKQIN